MLVADQPFTDDLLDSPAAMQLRRGFPWLRFREPLEQEFREAYRDQTKSRIKGNIWLSFAIALAFMAMHQYLLGGASQWVTNIRLFVLLPIMGAALLLLHSSWYQRLYAPLTQLLAPAFGIGVVVNALVAWQQGISFLPAVVLVTIAIYSLLGMFFYAALRSGLIVLATHVVGVVLLHVPFTEAVYSILVLSCANIVGGTFCYTLEKVNRTNYLEARLLTEMASRDGLTGIYNRRMFDEHLDKIWQQASRERVNTALLLVDIDHFKAYNDYYGHQAGDECLKHVARALARCGRRPLDFVARYGGEEFAIVLYNARRDYVEDVTQRIRQSLEGLALKHPASPAARVVTVSVGAACVLPQADRSHFGFVQLADEALYEAKGAGRNQVVIMDKEYEDLNTGAFRNRPEARQADKKTG
jgi:diguanylate cyclase (GGDEF)-like protein